MDAYEKREVRKKISTYVKRELRTLPNYVEMVVFYSALGLACHVTSGKTCPLAGPQVILLEACVSEVGTRSALGFFNLNQL